MNARRRLPGRHDWPSNLQQNGAGYYYWRNPETGKDFGLGKNKGHAFRESNAANLTLSSMKKSSIVNWVLGKESRSLEQWCDEYQTIIIKRGKLKPNSLLMLKSAIKAI